MAERSVRIRSLKAWRRPAAALLAAAAGTGAAVIATGGAASSLAATGVQVQADTVPASAYATPLASAELPVAPDPSGQGEWFLVSGATNATLLDEPDAGGAPSVVTTGLDDNGGASPYLSLVAVGGPAWAWSDADNDEMLGLTSTGAAYQIPGAVGALFKTFKPDAHDMTSDSSGNLYIPDSGGEDITRAHFNAPLGGNQWSLTKAFGSQKPAAVAIAGGNLWFTTTAGELGEVANPTSASSAISGPYDEQAGQTGPANGNGHTLTAGSDGNLWTVGGGTSGSGGSAILKVNPSTGAILGTFSAGLPAGAGITAITSGPDGNLWFTETGANEIGELQIATGTITNYPLPAGYQLPPAGSDMIASGANASGAVFFSAEAAGGAPYPAIGEVTGVLAGSGTTSTGTTTVTTTTGMTTTTTTTTTAATGRIVLPRTAKVSAKGVASVTLRCSGGRGAGACAGKLSLQLTTRQRVREGHKTVVKRVTATLGAVRFKVSANHTTTLRIKLSRAGLRALVAAHKHRLGVSAKAQPSQGKARTGGVTLEGPAKLRA